ncbi:hypothetical protein DL770_008087 [Monosporascus sp. CRB-9-2]|nr:hypothetical protein DL770_008087 [Monosporascus sp. CRB-9-2]
MGQVLRRGRKENRAAIYVMVDGTQKMAMEEVGFVRVEERDFKVSPVYVFTLHRSLFNYTGDNRLLGRDPKVNVIGRFARATLEQDIEGYMVFMANVVQGWTKEEITVYISPLRRKLRSVKLHPFYRQTAIWGQKPETS